jgi:hypothetical protein
VPVAGLDTGDRLFLHVDGCFWGDRGECYAVLDAEQAIQFRKELLEGWSGYIEEM